MAPTLLHPFSAKPTRVISVSGTDYEIGRRHAELCEGDVSNGMVAMYHRLWKRTLNKGTQGRWGFASRGAEFLLDPFLVNRLLNRQPASVRERIKGMADGSGMAMGDCATALVLPDLMPMLQALLTKLRPTAFVNPKEAPRFGCSSFVSSGKNFLHGRNLDFPGVGYWDRYQLIQMTAPTNKLRYVGFTTAGVPMAGISGVNEAQVSVSLHQHYCSRTSFSGTLPFVVGEEILANARDIKQAFEILRRSKVSTAWAFIVTDGKTREAFIVEKNPRDMGVRYLGKDDEVLAHSNFFQTGECKASGYATTERMNWDNYWRKTRLQDRVKAAGSNLDVAEAIQCVSEHYDPFWEEEKMINRTVATSYNIQSFVLDPENMKVWLAEGDAPVQLRDYGEYDLGEIFAGKNGGTGQRLPAYQFVEPKKRLAKQSYVLSFVYAFDGDDESALRWLKDSLSHDFCPEAAQVAALLELRGRRYREARTYLDQARGFIEQKVEARGGSGYPPEYFETTLHLARLCDLLNERERAKSLYKFVASHPEMRDPHIRKLAQKAGPYQARQIDKILMPYSSYVVFE